MDAQTPHHIRINVIDYEANQPRVNLHSFPNSNFLLSQPPEENVSLIIPFPDTFSEFVHTQMKFDDRKEDSIMRLLSRRTTVPDSDDDPNGWPPRVPLQTRGKWWEIILCNHFFCWCCFCNRFGSFRWGSITNLFVYNHHPCGCGCGVFQFQWMTLNVIIKRVTRDEGEDEELFICEKQNITTNKKRVGNFRFNFPFIGSTMS